MKLNFVKLVSFFLTNLQDVGDWGPGCSCLWRNMTLTTDGLQVPPPPLRLEEMFLRATVGFWFCFVRVVFNALPSSSWRICRNISTSDTSDSDRFRTVRYLPLPCETRRVPKCEVFLPNWRKTSQKWQKCENCFMANDSSVKTERKPAETARYWRWTKLWWRLQKVRNVKSVDPDEQKGECEPVLPESSCKY